MCGICAAVTLHQEPVPNYADGHRSLDDVEGGRANLAAEIDDALATIKHRGPDAQGQWISEDGNIGLGHVRLSIIDLSPSGNQPFHDAQQCVHAVVNGEIYDHERYKAELQNDFNFKGNSDCEIVIPLYQKYGLSFVSHLRGEFALALYDESRKLFFAARDRYGIKPLYYTMINGRLLVATEIKSFLAFGWKPEWDVQAIVDHGWRIDGRTMFKGVRKVRPGHYLISKHSEPPEERAYWDLEYPDKHIRETRTEEEMILEVRERLLEAVRLRLRADVPVGIYLSGGLDSSAIAGMVAHLLKERGTDIGSDASHDISRITCLCVQFEKDSGADESEIARRTAEWLGVDFLPVMMDDEALAAGFEEAVWYSETIMPDANGPGRMAIAARARKLGLKVVLTGEGADEHFGGYTWLRPESIREPDLTWPESETVEFDRARAVHAAENLPDLDFGGQVPPRPLSTSRMLNNGYQTRRLATLTPSYFAPWTKIYVDTNQETLMIESFDGRVRDAIGRSWHPLHAAQYIHTKTAFPNLLLRYVGDNVDMVHGIESRTPLLDHHVTQYANGLPPSLKMRYDPRSHTFDEKYILKKAVRPFINDEVYTRKKHSFVGPTRFHQNGPLRRVLERLVTRENVENLGFLDWNQTEPLIGRAFDDGDSRAFRAAMVAAQFVVLGQRFGVQKAISPAY